ncbi:unnamed protein product [Pedinophyceae sp. YPF-701]|nr:unnamed protein product [Pedinophyceae sp. YPF-701]
MGAMTHSRSPPHAHRGRGRVNTGGAATRAPGREKAAITRALDVVAWADSHGGAIPRVLRCCRGERRQTANPEQIWEHTLGQWIANQRKAVQGKGTNAAHPPAISVLDKRFGHAWRSCSGAVVVAAALADSVEGGGAGPRPGAAAAGANGVVTCWGGRGKRGAPAGAARVAGDAAPRKGADEFAELLLSLSNRSVCEGGESEEPGASGGGASQYTTETETQDHPRARAPEEGGVGLEGGVPEGSATPPRRTEELE